jgi:hypothetical protein
VIIDEPAGVIVTPKLTLPLVSFCWPSKVWLSSDRAEDEVEVEAVLSAVSFVDFVELAPQPATSTAVKGRSSKQSAETKSDLREA